MICIYCFHVKTKVVNSRPHKQQPQNWRRRQCLKCEGIFTTYERPSNDELTVQSDSSAKEAFNLGKLAQSIARASMHNQQQAEYDSLFLAQTVELVLLQRGGAGMNIAAQQIAEDTYDVLKRFDELAAMQYAMQHGLIVSVRRRGRPSTTATKRADGAERG